MVRPFLADRLIGNQSNVPHLTLAYCRASSEMNDDGIGCLFIIFCAIGVLIWFAWLGDSKLRYEIQYDDAEVTVDDKPHDCEFLTAPMGRKNCSYRKEVSVALLSKNVATGEPIISYDEGETWQWNGSGLTSGRRVHLYWVRTED